MNRMLTAAVLVAFAAPAIAQEDPTEEPRLSQLETIVITAQKEEPATAVERLRELEIIVTTAAKEQPIDHVIDDETAALLAEIAKEE